MSEVKDQIGWTSFDEEEASDEKIAVADATEGHGVGCCDTAFHVITSEDEFQDLLKGLQTEGKFGE